MKPSSVSRFSECFRYVTTGHGTGRDVNPGGSIVNGAGRDGTVALGTGHQITSRTEMTGRVHIQRNGLDRTISMITQADQVYSMGPLQQCDKQVCACRDPYRRRAQSVRCLLSAFGRPLWCRYDASRLKLPPHRLHLHQGCQCPIRSDGVGVLKTIGS